MPPDQIEHDLEMAKVGDFITRQPKTIKEFIELQPPDRQEELWEGEILSKERDLMARFY